MASALPLVYVVFAATSVLLLRLWRGLIPRPPYPPGPKKYWLIGNVRELPTTLPWLKLTEWAKQYGGIMHFRLFHQHIVVLSDVEATITLFEKRSRVYSDRPKVIMTDLMGWDFNAGLVGYNDKWRRHRKIYQQNFNKRQIQTTQEPTQILKVNQLLNSLLETPDEFHNHFRTVTAAIVMATIYDKEIPFNEIKRFAATSERALLMLAQAFMPGAVVVNTFPFLRYIPTWFPGAGFRKFAADCHACTTEMQEVPFQYVKEQMASGVEVSSMTADLLQRHYELGAESTLLEADIKAVAATTFAGSADTTVSTSMTFIYAMLLNTGVQKKAQDEIDIVIGKGRLPDFSDRPNLPYIEAIFREVMRWYPVTPLGVPHATSEDDVYEGYYIPKGTMVVPNIWAMTHNELRYPEPYSFNPERFFDKNGQLNDDDTVITFGFGRRICPGRHMATSVVWLLIATILATFDIRKAKDGQGNEIPVDGSYSNEPISHKRPFRCSITPRSLEARKLILDANIKA